MRLFLVRHGQTDCSARGAMCGQTCDAELNDLGQRTALAIAEGLAVLHPDVVVSSPQLRARQTAAPLAKALSSHVAVLPGLAELHYGSWDNLTPSEIRARAPEAYAAWEKDPAALAPPGGETVRQLRDRARAALDDIRCSGLTTALVVAHKTTLRVLLCDLLGVDVRDYRRRFALPLAGLSELELDREGARLVRHGDLSHLPPALRHLAGS